jgi:hypothetical protein
VVRVIVSKITIDEPEESEPTLDAVDELAPPPDPEQLPDGTVFGTGDFVRNDDGGDVLIGMAPKKRDPLDHAVVQTFIRRNGAAALPYGHTVEEENAMIQAFIAKNGATQVPLWAATTKDGKKAKTNYEASRWFGPLRGSPLYAQLTAGRRKFYDEGLSIQKSHGSLGGCGCPKKGHLACCSGSSGKKRKPNELPSGYCNNRECRDPITGPHKDKKYCDSECRERERYLRNLDRNVANSRKIPGKILGGIRIQYRETPYDINRLKSGEKPDFKRVDIYEEVDDLLTPRQRAAAIAYKHDLDTMDGRIWDPVTLSEEEANPLWWLRGWIQLPQDDDNQIRGLKGEKRRQIPRDRIDAVRQALGEDATKLIQKALGQPQRVAELLPRHRRGNDALGRDPLQTFRIPETQLGEIQETPSPTPHERKRQDGGRWPTLTIAEPAVNGVRQFDGLLVHGVLYLRGVAHKLPGVARYLRGLKADAEMPQDQIDADLSIYNDDTIDIRKLRTALDKLAVEYGISTNYDKEEIKWTNLSEK